MNMKEAFEDEIFVNNDRLRYEKNTLSSRLAILAIVFNALYFVSIYKSNVGSYYYNILIGASIVYNLLFMMLVFLVSEGSKAYNKTYSYLAIAFGVLQFVRILIIPMNAHKEMISLSKKEAEVAVMGNAQFTRVLVYLSVSGILLLASAVTGIIKCNKLNNHMKEISEE